MRALLGRIWWSTGKKKKQHHYNQTKNTTTKPQTTIKHNSTLLLGCKTWVFCVSELRTFVKFELDPELLAFLRTQYRCRSKETHLLSHGDQRQQQHMGHASKFPLLVSSIGKCCLSNISICNFYISLPKVKSQLGLLEKKMRTSLPNMCVFNPA